MIQSLNYVATKSILLTVCTITPPNFGIETTLRDFRSLRNSLSLKLDETTYYYYSQLSKVHPRSIFQIYLYMKQYLYIYAKLYLHDNNIHSVLYL